MKKKSKMSSLIEYLKSPELVVQIQEYFGIEYLNKSVLQNSKNCDYENFQNNEEKKKLHNRKNSDESVNSNQSTDNGSSDEQEQSQAQKLTYKVRNKFWYYVFIIGTALGDEIFYATFIPFWFWNIDGAVGRRIVFVWSSVMYVGQSLKDIIRWPRPGYPVEKLQNKWGMEYGMPSTHAMVAVSIPCSVLIYTMDRYEYSVLSGLIFTLVWVSVICVSRLYLGMHSVLDIIAGLLLTVILLLPLIPLVDYLDMKILTNWYSPLVVLAISILLIACYPNSDKWTPTRGDTTMTVSVTAGIQIGAWFNYQMGYIVSPDNPPPYEIIWPSYQMLGFLLLRTVLGMCCVVAMMAVGKSIAYAVVCTFLGKDKNKLRNSANSLENKNKIFVELCYKYFTCSMVGLLTQCILPNVFKLLGIGRPDFYTEI